MKLNVGCGFHILEGFINIDNLSSYQSAQHFRDTFINEYKNIDTLDKYIENGTFIVKDATVLDYPKESVDEIVSYRFIGRYDVDIESYYDALKDRGKLKIYCSKWNGDFFKKLTNTFDYIKIRRGSGAIEDEQDVHVICFKDSWLAINKISDFVDVLDS